MTECPRCGGEVKIGARFCPHCALDLSQMGQQSVDGTMVEPRGNSSPAAQTVLATWSCPVCGIAVAPGQRFCPSCGSPMDASAARPQVAADYQNAPGYNAPGYNAPGYPLNNQPMSYGAPPMGYAPPPARRSSAPMIIGIVALVLVLAGGGIAAYFLLAKDKNADSNSNSSSALSNTRVESNNSNTGTKPVAEETIDSVARKSVAAWQSNDSATIRQLTATSSQAKVQEQMKNFKTGAEYLYGGVTSISVTGTNVEGNTATAACMFKFGNGQAGTDTMYFAKENGAWKITSLFEDK